MAFSTVLGTLPKPQKIAIGVVGLVLVAALGLLPAHLAEEHERDALWQQNESLQAEVTKARADEATLRAFRIQAAALRKRLEAAKERLPSEREIPRLYRQISDLAMQAGLDVALFQPQPAEDKAVFPRCRSR